MTYLRVVLMLLKVLWWWSHVSHWHGRSRVLQCGLLLSHLGPHWVVVSDPWCCRGSRLRLISAPGHVVSMLLCLLWWGTAIWGGLLLIPNLKRRKSASWFQYANKSFIIRPLPEGGLLGFIHDHVLHYLQLIFSTRLHDSHITLLYRQNFVRVWKGPQLLLAKVKDADGQDWYIL